MTRFGPAGSLRGTLRPPPDKSISHRAALLAAMGEGKTLIERFLDSADTRATLTALGALDVQIDEGPRERDAIRVAIEGTGLRGAKRASLDCGNAGTLMRMISGWLAGQEGGEWSLDGDESLRRRPMDRIAEPLRAMGAKVECRDGRLPPIRIRGASLSGIEYTLPVASAQVKSCLLLAGLLAEGTTSVIEPMPTRDHTERMLKAAGAEISATEGRIRVRSAERIEPGPIVVPGDFSSAAFPLVAALLVGGSEVTLTGVGLNPTRTGLLDVLRRMGAEVEVGSKEVDTEPRGNLVVRSGPLQGTTVGAGEVPLVIDELPLVALIGCFAEGETVVRGAQELRHKESDRIAGLVHGLRALGADIEATEDGFGVMCTEGIRGGVLDAHGDHRIAMLGAVAGLASREGVDVVGPEAAAVSYPGFERDIGDLR